MWPVWWIAVAFFLKIYYLEHGVVALEWQISSEERLFVTSSKQMELRNRRIMRNFVLIKACRIQWEESYLVLCDVLNNQSCYSVKCRVLHRNSVEFALPEHQKRFCRSLRKGRILWRCGNGERSPHNMVTDTFRRIREFSKFHTRSRLRLHQKEIWTEKVHVSRVGKQWSEIPGNNPICLTWSSQTIELVRSSSLMEEKQD